MVRRFCADDLLALMEVRRSAIRGVASRHYTPAQIDAWVANSQDPIVQARRFGETTSTWVGFVGGFLAGFTNLGAAGYVDCMYVHADYLRRGVASALLSALEEEARRRGVASLHSEVSLTARPFFEARGFVVVTPQKVTVSGQTYDNFKMEKRL